MPDGVGSAVGNYHDWKTSHRQCTRSPRPVSCFPRNAFWANLSNTCFLLLIFIDNYCWNKWTYGFLKCILKGWLQLRLRLRRYWKPAIREHVKLRLHFDWMARIKPSTPCLWFDLNFSFLVFRSEVKKYMKKRKQGVTGNEVKPRWELDYDLLENEGLFGEYLEMGKSHH